MSGAIQASEGFVASSILSSLCDVMIREVPPTSNRQHLMQRFSMQTSKETDATQPCSVAFLRTQQRYCTLRLRHPNSFYSDVEQRLLTRTGLTHTICHKGRHVRSIGLALLIRYPAAFSSEGTTLIPFITPYRQSIYDVIHCD